MKKIESDDFEQGQIVIGLGRVVQKPVLVKEEGDILYYNERLPAGLGCIFVIESIDRPLIALRKIAESNGVPPPLPDRLTAIINLSDGYEFGTISDDMLKSIYLDRQKIPSKENQDFILEEFEKLRSKDRTSTNSKSQAMDAIAKLFGNLPPPSGKNPPNQK